MRQPKVNKNGAVNLLCAYRFEFEDGFDPERRVPEALLINKKDESLYLGFATSPMATDKTHRYLVAGNGKLKALGRGAPTRLRRVSLTEALDWYVEASKHSEGGCGDFAPVCAMAARQLAK